MNYRIKPFLGFIFAGLILLLITAIWLTPRISPVKLSGQQLAEVVEKIRQPRLILAMLAGGGLAAAGMTFQALFRNPLATEFTLGVSSGASLALAVGLACGLTAGRWGALAPMILALSGAVAAVAVVYAIARIQSQAPTATLLLGGVCINFICGAGIILVQYLAKEYEAKQVIHWLIGSVEAVGPDREQAVKWMGGFLMLGAGLLAWQHRALDLMMMGESIAAGKGVNVDRTRTAAYFVASLMTAAVVAVCGPIAFVGLVVPHLMRLLVGPNHRLLLPACLLFGASFLPWCDCLARNLIAWTTENNYTELPVGVVTNVVGGLFFLILLIRRKSDRPILV